MTPTPETARNASLRETLRTTDRRILTIMLVIFVQMLGSSMAIPIFPLYAQREFALSPSVITILIALFFVAQFFAGPYLGNLSDRYGRVPVLIISQLGTVISFIMIGGAQSLEILAFARLLDGFTGGNLIVAQAYITDLVPRERRTQALGLSLAAFSMGFVFGPAVGGILSSLFGPRMPFYVAAAGALVTAIITARTLDETISKERRHQPRHERTTELRPRDVLGNMPLMLLLVVSFLSQFGFGLMFSSFALFAAAELFEGYTQSQADMGIGLMLALFGVASMYVQISLLKRLLKLFQETTLVAWGIVLRGLSMIVLAVASSPVLGFVSMLIYGLGNSVFVPSLQSLCAATVDDDKRGGAMGYYESSRSLATIFSTALGGTLYSFDSRLPFWLSALLFGLALLPALYVHTRSPLESPVGTD